jgi:ABC-2 type transport system permease protein
MAVATPAGRQPHSTDLVRLKLRLLRNGFRGQTWRTLASVVGSLAGVFFALMAGLGLAVVGSIDRGLAFEIAVLAGSALVLGWALFPLLFFGVDETLDPARFALLPIRRGVLARGMLAAAFVGVPAIATLVASSGLVVAAGMRDGWVAAAVAVVGIFAGLVLGVTASRALTSAFAAMLRSRRVRDLAAVVIAVLASSIGPLQLLVQSRAQQGSVSSALGVARVLSWTPFGAPYAMAFDVAVGDWGLAVARLAITVAAIALLGWWWSSTIESAMLGAPSSSGAAKPTGGVGRGAVGALIPRTIRAFARPGPFGAVLACEWRLWWRDPRRRSSLISILMASAVVPIALNLSTPSHPSAGTGALPFSFAVTMCGTLAGMLLANQFAFDGNAFAAHLLAQVPGRVELRARGLAISLVAAPVQAVVVVAVGVLTHRVDQLPAGIGLLLAAFGAAISVAGLLSVLAPYALPENSNPFALNQGGGSARGVLALLAMLGTLVICAPMVIVATLLAHVAYGPWLVGVLGTGYGVGLVVLGTSIAGLMLDRLGPEVLVAVTPRR